MNTLIIVLKIAAQIGGLMLGRLIADEIKSTIEEDDDD